jgi:hypothetical protein
MRPRLTSVRLLSLAAALVAPLLAAATATAQSNEAAELRELIAEIEFERKMVFSPTGVSSYSTLFVLDRDHVSAIAGYKTFTGQLHPDSVESWTRQQIAFSRAAVRVMKEQLGRLERGEGWTSPPPTPGPTTRDVPNAQVNSGATYWPTPMDWREVRGQVRGEYRVQCYYRDSRLPELRGRFLLDLRGGSVVLGSYTDDRTTREANGQISSDAAAGGNGRANDSTLTWTAKFGRSGDALVIENSRLILVPSEPNGRCDSGVIDPD